MRNIIEMGVRIKQARMKRGLTQAVLGKKLGVTGAVISLWEKGHNEPKKLNELAAALNVSYDWLKYGEDSAGNLNSIDNFAIENKEKKTYSIHSLSTFKQGGDLMKVELEENIVSIEYALDYAQSLFKDKPESDIQIASVLTDCMKGTIDPSSEIFVDIKIKEFAGDGIYIFKFGSFFHMKRLQMQGNILAVLSDNKSYEKWNIEERDSGQLLIIGQVIAHQPNKFIRHR